MPTCHITLLGPAPQADPPHRPYSLRKCSPLPCQRPPLPRTCQQRRRTTPGGAAGWHTANTHRYRAFWQDRPLAASHTDPESLFRDRTVAETTCLDTATAFATAAGRNPDNPATRCTPAGLLGLSGAERPRQPLGRALDAISGDGYAEVGTSLLYFADWSMSSVLASGSQAFKKLNPRRWLYRMQAAGGVQGQVTPAPLRLQFLRQPVDQVMVVLHAGGGH